MAGRCWRMSALIDSRERNNGGIHNLVGNGDDVYGISGAALPLGTVLKSRKGYEEVRVPAPMTLTNVCYCTRALRRCIQREEFPSLLSSTCGFQRPIGGL